MYERHKQPMASRRKFLRRLALNGLIGFVLLMFSLAIGMIGYHSLEGLSWIDSLLNASMILGGMGPVDPMKTNAVCWYSYGTHLPSFSTSLPPC